MVAAEMFWATQRPAPATTAPGHAGAEINMVFPAILLSLAVLPGHVTAIAPQGAPQPVLAANDEEVGPTFLRKIPLIRDLFGDDAPTRQDNDARPGSKPAAPIDESYYEPEPIVPTPSKPAATKPAAAVQKPAPAETALSCEKATLVVSSFGFSSVEASSCIGRIYAFNAKRDGKTFAIKLDAASGELTEVRKLP